MKIHKSNISKPKENTKSSAEKNLEEERFKKYEAIINKLTLTVSNKDKIITRTEHNYSKKLNNSVAKNKSNFKLTIDRTKDDRNDKDFLSTFMNNDSLPILPKNLHLLSDNDTNQSISNTEKFRNLANLMIDDKELYSEKCFIRNSEDKLMLSLYTTLGRDAKKLFLEEENSEKLSKKRLLFHKLNDIKVPKFGFKKPINEKKEISKKATKNLNKIYNLNINENNNKKDEEKEENEEEKEKECYFKQEEKGYFHIPQLININEFKRKEKSLENRETPDILNKKFWDPDIDGDLLSYINHNIIKIEDIYNKDENEQIKKNMDMEDIDEDKIVPVNAQEIVSSDSEIDEEFDKKNSNDEFIMPKKNKIRFSEFCGISSYQSEVICQVDSDKIKELQDEEELKRKHTKILNRISSFNEKFFPLYSFSLSKDLIYRITTRNESNKIEKTDIINIDPTPKVNFYEKSTKKLIGLRKNEKKKTYIIDSKNVLSSFNINDSHFTLQDTILKENTNTKNTHIKLNEDNSINTSNLKRFVNNNSFISYNKKNEDSIININNNTNYKDKNEEIDKSNKMKKNKDKKFIDKNQNKNGDNIKRIFTLKDLFNNESILSDINNKNLSGVESYNESFNMNDKNNIFNFTENNKQNDNKKTIEEDNDETFKFNEEKNSEKNNVSKLYSDNQSGSQKINKNSIKLTFSSRKST